MSSFGGSNKQDVELNITPIIDCFTVLITFMLASASFISIGFFEANTPGNTPDPQAKEPDTEAVLRVKGNHTAELKVKGKQNFTLSFSLNTKEGFTQIDEEFSKLKKSDALIGSVLMSAEDEVDYKSVAEVMDHLNQTELPIVVGDF